MTATDELRRLLDERGVEWGAEESELDHVTTWNANGGQAMFYESKTTNPNLLQVNYYHLTPVQAVEATLGRGTCRITVEDNLAETEGTGDVWLECSACHWQMPLEPTPPRFDYCPPLFSYCPNCGRRIEVDA